MNDEIRMSKLEGIRNQMTRPRPFLVSSFVLRHSFVIRHSCFVIFLALGITQLFAEKRPITEKVRCDLVWIGDAQVSLDGSRVVSVRVTVNVKKVVDNTYIC